MVVGWDGYVCFMLAGLTACLVGAGAKAVADANYADYVEEHTVAEGEIGGIAGEDVFRAQSVADLLENDTFTVISPGIEWHNEGNGYYHDGSGWVRNFVALKLPSGEMVAADINTENVQRAETVGGDTILPVGHVVYEDLTKDRTFLNQIQFSRPLSRKDFYIDMTGDGAKMSQEQYSGYPEATVSLITWAVMFPLLHALGARLGLWGYYLPHRGKENRRAG